MLATLALFIFPVLMAYAASSDLLTMRIANWLVILVVLSYLGLALVLHIPWDQIGWAAVAALAVLVVAFAFFAFGWIGGGDAKLVSATAMWVGTTVLHLLTVSPRIRAIRPFMAAAAISWVGWCTVVRPPAMNSAPRMLSKPTSERSSGTCSPA